MTTPDFPRDSVTVLPYRDWLAAIRERFAAFAYSGPTPADRERDHVIGYLLDRVDLDDQADAGRDPRETEITESGLDAIGHKWVDVGFGCHGDAKVVTCCGCGFPVDQNNTRCLILDPDGYMGTYGPCCAPTGKKLEKARRRVAKRHAQYRDGGGGGE